MTAEDKNLDPRARLMPLYHGRFPDWHTLYEQEEFSALPWFYQDLDPDLAQGLQDCKLTQGRFLDLGTGPGTQAIALAHLGFDVTGSDLSQAAVEKAQTMSDQVHFIQDDILETRLEPGFDAILDRGCFHVFAPEIREQYVRTVARLLNPGGYLFLKAFSVKEAERPVGPYRFSPEDIRTIFEPAFRIVSTKDTVYHGTLAEKPKALFAVLQKQ